MLVDKQFVTSKQDFIDELVYQHCKEKEKDLVRFKKQISPGW
jgi:hypothetical protein